MFNKIGAKVRKEAREATDVSPMKKAYYCKKTLDDAYKIINNSNAPDFVKAEATQEYARMVKLIEKDTGVKLTTGGKDVDEKVKTGFEGKGRKKNVTESKVNAYEGNILGSVAIENDLGMIVERPAREVIFRNEGEAQHPVYTKKRYTENTNQLVEYEEDGRMKYYRDKQVYNVPNGYNWYGSNEEFPPNKYPEAYEYPDNTNGKVPLFYMVDGDVFCDFVSQQDYKEITGHTHKER